MIILVPLPLASLEGRSKALVTPNRVRTHSSLFFRDSQLAKGDFLYLCGYILMVNSLPSKQMIWVRFPLSARGHSLLFVLTPLTMPPSLANLLLTRFP
jgi:hypothetical protein